MAARARRIVDQAIAQNIEPQLSKSKETLRLRTPLGSTLLEKGGRLTVAGKRFYDRQGDDRPQGRTFAQPDIMGNIQISRDGNKKFVRGPSGRKVVLEVWDPLAGKAKFTTGRERARRQEGVYVVDIPVIKRDVRTEQETEEYINWGAATDTAGEVRMLRSEDPQAYLWSKLVAEVGRVSGGQHVVSTF